MAGVPYTNGGLTAHVRGRCRTRHSANNASCYSLVRCSLDTVPSSVGTGIAGPDRVERALGQVWGRAFSKTGMACQVTDRVWWTRPDHVTCRRRTPLSIRLEGAESLFRDVALGLSAKLPITLSWTGRRGLARGLQTVSWHPNEIGVLESAQLSARFRQALRKTLAFLLVMRGRIKARSRG